MPFYMNDDFPKRKSIPAAGRKLSGLVKADWRSPHMYWPVCSRILEYCHIFPISRIMSMILPHNQWGDRVCNLLKFRERRGRFIRLNPSREYADQLWGMRMDGTFSGPLYRFVTDKELAKLYIASLAGWNHVIETYKILRTEEEVDNLILDRFPCVLKPTHSSGNLIVQRCPEQPLNREVLKNWLRIDYYRNSREQNYRRLEPKIIVEEFFSQDGRTTPDDYKILCIDGVPKIIQVDADRYGNHTQNFYDIHWNRLRCEYLVPNRPQNDPRPEGLGTMLDISAKLSKRFSLIRVDIYANGREIKVGELTVMPNQALLIGAEAMRSDNSDR